MRDATKEPVGEATLDRWSNPAGATARNLKMTWLGLFASGSTLLCCALPALLVGIGAGAVLVSLTSAVPQLIWLSEHKVPLFILAGIVLLSNGVLQWRMRTLPCPIDPGMAERCATQRRRSRRLYVASVVVYAIGGFFAFVAPYVLV